MSTRSVIVIGGSTGALETLRAILSALPRDLAASVFITIHTAPDSPGVMDRVLSRSGPLPAHYAVDNEPIVPGRVYLAPPDRHLLVKYDHVRVTAGPRENRFRPAVDPLFRTAAAAYGPAVIGVILSGGQDDGAVGLAAIKAAGGIALVQDPEEALASGMPEAAIRHVRVDHVLHAPDIAAVIAGLVQDRLEAPEIAMPRRPRTDIAEGGAHDIHHANQLGPPSPFTCPDCGGTLWQAVDGELLQFQCHIGHRFSGDALALAQQESLDQALWVALRALEESAELRRRMAHRAYTRGMTVIADTYSERAESDEQRAAVIRRVLMPGAKVDEPTAPTPAAPPAASEVK